MSGPWKANAGRSISKLVLWAAAVAVLLWAAQRLGAQELLRKALVWIEGQGPLGAAVFVLLYIVACVFLLPGSILTLGAGAIFGVLKGLAIAWVGATLGATAAFLVGRYLARDWVAKRIEGSEKFRAIDDAVSREGWKIVGLTRLSPVFPFNVLNYVYGLTKVSVRDYVVASWIGMLPGTAMYVYLGSAAGSLTSLGRPNGTRTPAEWALYGLGLLATLAVTVSVTRIARAALAKKSDPLSPQGRKPERDLHGGL